MTKGEVFPNLAETILNLDSQELSEIPVRIRGHAKMKRKSKAGIPGR